MMDRDELVLAYCNSGYTETEAEDLADRELAAGIEQATNRRQAQLDELEILSRHLHDPENNPL